MQFSRVMTSASLLTAQQPTTSSAGQETKSSSLTVGGLATGLGSLRAVVTGVLYALSPPAAASPMRPFDLAAPLAGAVAGSSTMRAAGTVGIFSAAPKENAGAFVGFKLLFDTLFLLGTVTFGAGAALAMASEYRAIAPLVNKPVALVSVLVGLTGAVAAGACFAGLPLELAVGASIGLGAILFTVIGVQIALSGLSGRSVPVV